MSKLFYHGFVIDNQEGEYSEAVKHMIDIINSGEIKMRSEIGYKDNDDFNYVCLYRKNDNIDYNSLEWYLKTARAGWIDKCMVFVISNKINATYLPPNVEVEGLGGRTDLVDEWRCKENIPLDKIIGIALPLNTFKETLDGKDFFSDEKEIKKLKEALKELRRICKSLGLKTFNSEIEGFTDKIDSQYLSTELSEQDISDLEL